MKQSLNTHVSTRVFIRDADSSEVLLDKSNAIHNRNMAVAIARGLANSTNHQIYKIDLGNGGTTIDSNDDVFFNTPNITGAAANLYNVTYSEIIDEQTGAPAENSVVNSDPPLPTDVSTTVLCHIELTANEPAGQNPDDGGPVDMEDGTFVFDELGLKTQDDLLLSHIIFSPIEKTANRHLIIEYTLTITVS